MKLTRTRTRARMVCALAAVASSALLAGGGVLASPAAASAGRVQLAKPAHPTAVRRLKLVAHRRRLPKLGRRSAHRPHNRVALASDGNGGFYTHVTPLNTSLFMLDVSGASTEDYARVIIWPYNGGANQVWHFVPINNPSYFTPAEPTYEIIDQNSHKCLTDSDIAGSGVYIFPCDGELAQTWSTGLVNPSDSNTYYSIQSMLSGLYLDVYGDAGGAGTTIDTWPGNNGDNQYFGAI